MKLSKEAEHAILICLYLERAGAAFLKDIAKYFRVKNKLLKPVVDILMRGEIVVMIGEDEYALSVDPKMKEILDLFSQIHVIDLKYLTHEERAMHMWAKERLTLDRKFLNKRISQIMESLVRTELLMLERNQGTEN